MKKIECIIRPSKLHDLEQTLRRIGIGGMTIYEVKGFGKEQTRPDEYLFLPKTKLEIYCMDSQVEEIVEAICKTCESGKLGDGKIAILPVDELVRVRTGERGDSAA